MSPEPSHQIKTDGEVDAVDDEAALMAKYGITCVPIDRFHYNSYRYTALGDAIAQAKRDTRSS